MKVCQQEIQDGGLKKGNALSITAILEVTYTKYRLELHITQKHNSNDYVHVCEVSESNAIDIYATQTQKKLEVAIMTDKMEDYFIVGPITAIGYISTIVQMFAAIDYARPPDVCNVRAPYSAD